MAWTTGGAAGGRCAHPGLRFLRAQRVVNLDRTEWYLGWLQLAAIFGSLWPIAISALQNPLDRAGADCLVTDARAGNFDNDDDGACLYFQSRDGRRWREQDQLEIGPDGSHSALRQQMCPDEGARIRGGEVMWR